MYLYPVITASTTDLSENNINHNTTNRNMSRNRSASAAAAPSPALLSRGFASLRRAHRRLSISSPSSPLPDTSSNQQALAIQTNGISQQISDSDVSSSVRPRVRLVPNVGLSSRSFVFNIIDRELENGTMYRIGRFSERNALTDRLSFKSKVVSRNHAEMWAEQGKVYLRDIGSSSGTFLNRIRLSPPNHASEPHEIKDGDAIQLGVDYQGGFEAIYRAVRIRAEINRQPQSANSPYARNAFQQLRSHLLGSSAPTASSPIAFGSPTDLVQPLDLGLHREPTKVYENASPDSPKIPLSELMSKHNMTNMSKSDIQECCICLYAIAPFQALFVAPCSHVFHFKCLRPIVYQNYPGFSCPLCRNYFDLEASVAVEVEEVLEAMNFAKEKQHMELEQQQVMSPIDTLPELNEEEEFEYDNSENDENNSSIQPDNLSNEEEADSLEHQLKHRLDISSQATSISSSTNHTAEQSSAQSTGSIPQTISTNHGNLQPPMNQEGLLSSTLVDHCTFNRSVLSASNENNNIAS